MSAGDWDMSDYFSAPDGADYREFTARLDADVAALLGRARALPGLSDAAAWSRFVMDLEDFERRLQCVSSYLFCLGSADVGDDAVTAATAELAALEAEHDKLRTALKARFRGAGDAEFDALVGLPDITSARYQLGRLREEAKRMMSTELEDLASDLGVVGFSAWGRLYDRMTGSLTYELAVDGQPAETKPMSTARSLIESPIEDVRVAAFEGANRAWESAATPLAACLNSISGTRLALQHRRGVDDPIEPAIFDAGISRATLDTMLAVVEERAEVARDFYRLKARRLGRDALRWCDLHCALPGQDQTTVSWTTAKTRVLAAFDDFYPALGEFAAHAFDQRWIDHEPRQGKRTGAFCSSSHHLGQSRVFLTFNGADGDVQTLAHELGHAFHAWTLRDERFWSTRYPMTLAETASTFAESIVTDSMLASDALTDAQKLSLLDAKLTDAAVFLLNIPTRFYFERAMYERRATGELSPADLCGLMVEAQTRCYGDVLHPEHRDPWFWASKLHFFLTDVSFYNFPYTFGFLLSSGLFARAKREGPGFLATYERLLRSTAVDSPENVVENVLGIDLRAPDFWHEAIDLVATDLERYRQLLNAETARTAD